MFKPRLMHAVVLFAIPMAAFLGCCHCKHTMADQKPFTIELSSGGGFSGLWNGYIIRSDGAIQSWHGKQMKTDEVKDLGQVEPDDIAEVKTILDRDKIMNLALHETGNMTTMLKVTSGDEMTFITWPGSMDDEGQVPAQVLETYTLILKLVQQMR